MSSEVPPPTSYDVIIVGAGIEGSSAAYSLAKEGRRVLLLEQFRLPHSRGSSTGHSRITRYAYEQDYYVRMMVDAFPLWAQLQKESGQKLFTNCGTLELRTPGSTGEAAVLAALSKYNCPHELLTPEELTRRFPMVAAPDGCNAVWDPSGGLLRADKCLEAFQTMFKSLGGVLRDSEPVESIIPGDVVTIKTSRNVYRAPNVVFATGPWTGRWCSTLNLDLPFKPIRISVYYWKVAKDKYKEHTPIDLPCMLDSRGEGAGGTFHVYGTPTEEYPGLVKVALHNGPDINPDFRDACDAGWVETTVKKYVAELMPFLDASQPALQESCIYTMTPDNDPFIGRHPQFPNIVVCAGFSGHGFKLSPAVGKAVSELVMGKAPTYNMEPFRLDRFAPKSNL